MAMYLSRQLTKNSFSAIGKVFGGRSRSSVIHACRVVKARSAADANIRQIVHYLENQLMR
jgi:chromosomal replication initiator protein